MAVDESSSDETVVQPIKEGRQKYKGCGITAGDATVDKTGEIRWVTVY